MAEQRRGAHGRRNSALPKRVGRRIRELRDAKGIKRRALARAAGVSVTSLVQIEAGQVEARLGTLDVLARTLGVKPGDLFIHDPLPEPAPRPAPTPGAKIVARIVERLGRHEDDVEILRVIDRIVRDLDRVATRSDRSRG